MCEVYAAFVTWRYANRHRKVTPPRLTEPVGRVITPTRLSRDEPRPPHLRPDRYFPGAAGIAAAAWLATIIGGRSPGNADWGTSGVASRPASHGNAMANAREANRQSWRPG